MSSVPTSEQGSHKMSSTQAERAEGKTGPRKGMYLVAHKRKGGLQPAFIIFGLLLKGISFKRSAFYEANAQCAAVWTQVSTANCPSQTLYYLV